MVSSTYTTTAVAKKESKKYVDACLTITKALPDYFTEQGIADMSQDLQRHLLYVTMNSSEVVGFATIHKKDYYVAEISWMAVKPEHQRLGIGSALVDRVANELRSQGIRVLEVKTLSADIDYFPYEKTRRFYEKMDFMHIETIDPYPDWEPGSPCAIYVKVL